mgnify:CR=1 FL=1
MNKRFIGMVVLLLVVGFYALGTGFDFFFRFLYVLLLVSGGLAIGLAAMQLLPTWRRCLGRRALRG